MKKPLFFTRRFASVLALGCTLLVFSPAPQALAQKKTPPPVALTPVLLDEIEKVVNKLAADAPALEELQAVNHENELDPTVAGSDDAMAKKYPKLAASEQAVGLKPHEFIGALITVFMTNRSVDNEEAADGKAVTQANSDFVKANHDRVKAIVKIVMGEK